jgi:hypothetical protein
MKVQEAAQLAMERADNEVQAATAILEDMACNDPDLYNALLSPFLNVAAYEACRALCRQQRQKIWTAPNYDQGGNGHRVLDHAMSLMDFPLPGGKRLRDATKADLEEASSFFAKQAADMSHKARWLSAIASKVKGKKTVADVFDADSLAKLRESV